MLGFYPLSSQALSSYQPENYVFSAVGSAYGASTVLGSSVNITYATGSASGTSAATFAGSSFAESVGSSSGYSNVIGHPIVIYTNAPSGSTYRRDFVNVTRPAFKNTTRH